MKGSVSVVRNEAHDAVRQFLRLRLAQPERNHPARQREGGEDGGDDADGERHREALHRASSHVEKDHGGDEGGEVRVDDRRQSPRKAGIERLNQGPAPSPLLAHALVNDDVGVHRHADSQHDAGNARHGERGPKHRENRDDQADVGCEREVGDHAERAVGNEHEADDEQARHDRGELTRRDGIGAKAWADCPFFNDRQVGWQRTGAQQHCKVVGRLRSEVAGNLARSTEDRFVDARAPRSPACRE